MASSERFTFFRGGPFSQFHPSPFDLDGEHFVTAEQFMMAGKAALFGDADARRRIMATVRPRKQKALGRQVAGFDATVWNSCARDIVYRGNRAKFLANPDLLALLLATGTATLVEASPTDTIWGIGLAGNHPDATVRERWRGQNWLGETLTKLRDDILAGR